MTLSVLLAHPLLLNFGSAPLIVKSNLPKDIIHHGYFIAGHPGGKFEEPELSGDDRGELCRVVGHHQGSGECDVLPDTPGPRPRHGAHQLDTEVRQGVNVSINLPGETSLCWSVPAWSGCGGEGC